MHYEGSDSKSLGNQYPDRILFFKYWQQNNSKKQWQTIKAGLDKVKAAILLLLGHAEGSDHCLMLHIVCASANSWHWPFAVRISGETCDHWNKRQLLPVIPIQLTISPDLLPVTCTDFFQPCMCTGAIQKGTYRLLALTLFPPLIISLELNGTCTEAGELRFLNWSNLCSSSQWVFSGNFKILYYGQLYFLHTGYSSQKLKYVLYGVKHVTVSANWTGCLIDGSSEITL